MSEYEALLEEQIRLLKTVVSLTNKKLRQEEARLSRIIAVVEEQALDEALWFVSKVVTEPGGGDTVEVPLTIGEATLQKALRRLHAAIERHQETPVRPEDTREVEDDLK